MDRIPRAPNGTKAAGRRLWRAVLEQFELEEHELSLLVQAVHVADLCTSLQEQVDAEGVVVGGRTNPASVELRLQRQLLAKLIVSLRVPIGEAEDESRAQRRAGFRGHYGIRGVV